MGIFSDLADIREQEQAPALAPRPAEQRPTRPPNRKQPIPQAGPPDRAPTTRRVPAVVVAEPPPAADTADSLMPADAAIGDGAMAPAPLPFDLATPAKETNTYAFSKDELWAIQDMVQELDRQFDIQVTRYNLVRLAVHSLIEDFRATKDQSFAYQRLRHPKK